MVDSDGYMPEQRQAARDVGSLTEVEVEILRYLAHGLHPLDIAMMRQTGYETVKSQVSHLRAKLGAKTAAHAVAIALRHGIID